MRWPVLQLQEFCRTGSGTTPSRERAEFYSGNIPWVKSGELRENIITSTEEHISEEALKRTSLKIVPSGALLVAMYGATVGRVGLLGIEATTNQAVCHIVPDPDRADQRYMFHLLQARAAELVSRGVGGAQPNISQGTIKSLEIPLPPLAEQKRIAAILDQADALRRLRRRALDRLNALGQSIFHEMFGRDDDGDAMPLGDVIEIRSSLADPTDKAKRSLLHVGPEHIDSGSGQVSWDRVRTCEEDRVTSGKYEFADGDILYSKIRPYLNKVAIADRSGLCSADMYALRPLDHVMTPEYLHFLLGGTDFLQYAESVSSRANIPKINRKQLCAFVAPMPKIKEQEIFSRRLRRLGEMRVQSNESLSQFESLFASLQSRAFAGDI